MNIFHTFFITLLLFTMTSSFTYRLNSRQTENIIIDKNHKEIEPENSVAYVKASIPMRLLQCTEKLQLLKCMKIFILERLEKHSLQTRSSNLTADFLEQIFSFSTNDVADDEEMIFNSNYLQLNDVQLNERLLIGFQTFFKNREIKLHFIPGVTVRVIPNSQNKIMFSMGKGKQSRIPRKVKPQDYLIQLGVPTLMMPAILLGTVLPFLLPLKLAATIWTGLINNGALMAAIMYAAKNSLDDNTIYAGTHHNIGI